MRSWINNQSLSKKLIILYTLAIFLPLVIIDGLLTVKLYQAEETRRRNKMEAEAEALEYNLESMLASAILLSRNVGLNTYMRTYLAQSYASPLEYWRAYQEFMKGSFLESLAGIDSNILQIYADNDTIISGGYFHTLSSALGQEWMQDFRQSGKDSMLIFYFDAKTSFLSNKRKVMLLNRLESAPGTEIEQIACINVEYSSMARSIVAQHYEFPAYICDGDRILFSGKVNHSGMDSEHLPPDIECSLTKDILLCGKPLRIILEDEGNLFLAVLMENRILFLCLLGLSFFLPSVLIHLIGQSIRVRIKMLADIFTGVESDTLSELPPTSDRDEIGLMMQDYNRMAKRMNALIETVYKNRLREQEMDIARQEAELLALRSQINPHFLFNALESIRMHSLLRQEYDTALMVEKLAMMERQNVDWGNDVVPLRQEVSFLESYLELQRLRFGERVRYQMETEGCEDYLIPKLTLVTFVENACVHSLEKKNAQGWIFVRAWEKGEILCLEVEDTGNGMEEEFVQKMNEDMKNASIQMLQSRSHVGIINACLRLKMLTGGKACFEVESEPGIGTIIHIEMPKIYDQKKEGADAESRNR